VVSEPLSVYRLQAEGGGRKGDSLVSSRGISIDFVCRFQAKEIEKKKV
jgi:hypothetical protein